MGWAIGYDRTWKRDVGYGVPAICDDPECSAEIDRGLAYVCGGDLFGGDCGCGLHFCGSHLFMGGEAQQCRRCRDGEAPFQPKPDTTEWIEHKLTCPTWADWRAENPEEVATLSKQMAASAEPPLPHSTTAQEA